MAPKRTLQASHRWHNRQMQLLSLLREYHAPLPAAFKEVAERAKSLGVYSEHTNLGDIENTLYRVWRKRDRIDHYEL